MKKSIILIFAACTLTLHSQNAIKYNRLVNKAELSVVDSNYTEALNFYQTAFSELEYPFTIDYYNALLCATFTGDYDLSFEYMYRLVDKGIEYDKFKNNKYLKPLQADKRWADFKNYYDENHQKIVSRFDIELKAELDSMHERDQKANRDRYKNPALRYKFDSTIYANIVRMKEIFEIYGFPTEEDLGVKAFNDYQFSYFIMTTHYFQVCEHFNKKDSLNYLPILEKAVLDGKLSYRFFLSNFNDLQLNKYASNVVYLVDTNIILPNIDTNSLSVINANRAKLGIGTVAETHKKTIFYIRKIFKPIPIQEGQDLRELTEAIHNNIDLDYFLIGNGTFSHHVVKPNKVDYLVNYYKNKKFKLE